MPDRVTRRRWLYGAVIAGVLFVCGAAAYFGIPAVRDWIHGPRVAPAIAVSPPTTPPVPAADAVTSTAPVQSSSAPTAMSASPRYGFLAPDFSLSDLAGNLVTLSQFRGKVVILDFWASWCGPCRASMPTVHALWKAVEERGVVLVGVSLDRTLSAASYYLAANKLTDMTALWGSLSESQAVADRYSVSGIPHTFVIDRAGIIRFANHPIYLTREILDPLL